MTEHTIDYVLFGLTAAALGFLFTFISRDRMKKFTGDDFFRFQPMFHETKKKNINFGIIQVLLIGSVFFTTNMDEELFWSDGLLMLFNLLIINGFWWWNSPHVYIGENGIAQSFSWRAYKDSIQKIVIPNDIGQELCSYKVIFKTDRKLLKIDIMRTRTAEFEKVLKKYDFPIE